MSAAERAAVARVVKVARRECGKLAAQTAGESPIAHALADLAVLLASAEEPADSSFNRRVEGEPVALLLFGATA